MKKIIFLRELNFITILRPSDALGGLWAYKLEVVSNKDQILNPELSLCANESRDRLRAKHKVDIKLDGQTITLERRYSPMRSIQLYEP